MKIQISYGCSPSNWEEIILSLDGHIYHCSLWAEYKKILQGEIPLYISGFDEKGKGLCACICYLKKSRIPFRKKGISIYTDSLPVVKDRDEELLKEFLQEIELIARKEKAYLLEIGSLGADIPFEKEFKELGYQTVHRIEFLIDLTLSPEILWENLRRNHRRSIKKARESGVSIVEGTSPEDILTLRNLQLSSSERSRKRGIGFSLGEKRSYLLKKTCLMDRGIAKFFMAKKEKEIISSYLTSIFNKRSEGIHFGSNAMATSIGAPILILWEMFLKLKGDGYNEFNLGGVPAEARQEENQMFGLYNFKLGFGGKEVNCYGGRKILLGGSRLILNP